MDYNIGLFRAAVAAVIINDNNDVLITQRSFKRDHHAGEWEIMTGRLAQGETFEDALHREVKEELDIKVGIITILNTFHFYHGPEKLEHVGVVYLVKHSGGEVKVDGIEEIASRWVNLDEAINIVKDESIKKNLQTAKKYLNKV